MCLFIILILPSAKPYYIYFILICLKEMYGIKLPSAAPVQLVKAHTGPVYSVKFNRAG